MVLGVCNCLVKMVLDYPHRVKYPTAMKLADWSRKHGISYKTAYRMFRAGTLPRRCEQLPTGTIIVHEEEPAVKKIVIYARVSSHDQKKDLGRQVGRIRDFCAARGWTISDEVTEIGSGLNRGRVRLMRLLGDPAVTDIVVEYRDRLMRFGFEFVEATLASTGRRLHVVNETEFKDDLVQDFVDVVTCMCVRIYGRRAARNRAKKALEATK